MVTCFAAFAKGSQLPSTEKCRLRSPLGVLGGRPLRPLPLPRAPHKLIASVSPSDSGSWGMVLQTHRAGPPCPQLSLSAWDTQLQLSHGVITQTALSVAPVGHDRREGGSKGGTWETTSLAHSHWEAMAQGLERLVKGQLRGEREKRRRKGRRRKPEAGRWSFIEDPALEQYRPMQPRGAQMTVFPTERN